MAPVLALLAYTFVAAVVYEALEDVLGRWAAAVVAVIWPPVVLFTPFVLAFGLLARFGYQAAREWRRRGRG